MNKLRLSLVGLFLLTCCFNSQSSETKFSPLTTASPKQRYDEGSNFGGSSVVDPYTFVGNHYYTIESRDFYTNDEYYLVKYYKSPFATYEKIGRSNGALFTADKPSSFKVNFDYGKTLTIEDEFYTSLGLTAGFRIYGVGADFLLEWCHSYGISTSISYQIEISIQVNNVPGVTVPGEYCLEIYAPVRKYKLVKYIRREFFNPSTRRYEHPYELIDTYYTFFPENNGKYYFQIERIGD